MAAGRVSRGLMGPLLAVNAVVSLIILATAGWSLDKCINGEHNHPRKFGWESINDFHADIALLAGVIGVSSVLPGFIHLRAWRSDSLASAGSLAIISWVITALAFGLVCKEIILGGHRGKRLQTLEALIIISFLSQLLYLLLLYAGKLNTRYGPSFRSYNTGGYNGGITMGDEPHKTGSSSAISL